MVSPPTESTSPVPANVRQLIERHIRSATELDVLLLLYRAPETYWGPSAAAAVVGAREEVIRAHLGRFEAAGLIQRGRNCNAYRFAPDSEDVRAAVEALATIYSDDRNEVLRILVGSLSQISAFSDAFRFSDK